MTNMNTILSTKIVADATALELSKPNFVNFNNIKFVLNSRCLNKKQNHFDDEAYNSIPLL